MLEHLWHDIGNTKVEIVSLLSQGQGEAMVHTCYRKYKWGYDEHRDNFCLAFFPMSRIVSLPRAILDFKQNEESIGVAWARFLVLIHTGLDLSLLDGILL